MVVAMFWIVGIALVIGVWVACSYMEAKTFNRLTGAHATTIDAMFAELRVQAAPDSLRGGR